MWRSKRGRTTFGDGGSSKAGEVIRMGGAGGGGNAKRVRRCAITINPTPSPSSLMPTWARPDTWAVGLGHSDRRPTWVVRPCGLATSVTGPASFKETGPILFITFYFYFSL
jgi:hypothetical protein